MKCHACGIGLCKLRTASQLLERGVSSVVIRGVPALVCEHCGEVYFAAEVTRSLLHIAEAAFASGKELTLEQYRAA